MKIDVYHTPLGLTAGDLTGRAVVVIDVLRATSTIVTPALLAAQGGDPVLVAAALNFSAVAERARHLFTERGDLVVICAGRDKQFALEDAYTAGRLIKAVKKGVPPKKLLLNDAAQVSFDLAAQQGGWQDALGASDAARQLGEAGLGDDVKFCANPDRVSIVPVYADRRIAA